MRKKQGVSLAGMDQGIGPGLPGTPGTSTGWTEHPLGSQAPRLSRGPLGELPNQGGSNGGSAPQTPIEDPPPGGNKMTTGPLSDLNLKCARPKPHGAGIKKGTFCPVLPQDGAWGARGPLKRSWRLKPWPGHFGKNAQTQSVGKKPPPSPKNGGKGVIRSVNPVARGLLGTTGASSLIVPVLPPRLLFCSTRSFPHSFISCL